MVTLLKTKIFFQTFGIAAINDANKKLKESAANHMSSLSDGMGLPPGMKLPF